MEDLDWKLQLKESEVALAYKEVQECQSRGCEFDIAAAKQKLKKLQEEEAALAFIVLEQNVPPEQKTASMRRRVDELVRRFQT